ncbi:MAG: hypothetical protein KIT02_10410 [Devosia sp.]|uniref:hypothetical protein n=1 Tax=Devosia sp. TaxID=1871048 RepID=UPI0024C5EC8A|nr:hypothetical protein [Devosia sp.]UYN98378.1 MAG: hypothetical protein KIT02_10410 [Devosia sp.]
MSRPAPRIEVRDIVARGIFDPSGAHLLEVAVPSGVVGMRFTLAQVEQLKIAITAFETEAISKDGGPDFYYRKAVPLEVRR